MYIYPVNELLRFFFFFIVDSLFKRNSYNDPLYITHIKKWTLPSLHGRTSNIRFNVAMARDHRRSFIMYVLIPATDFYDCTILCCATLVSKTLSSVHGLWNIKSVVKRPLISCFSFIWKYLTTFQSATKACCRNLSEYAVLVQPIFDKAVRHSYVILFTSRTNDTIKQEPSANQHRLDSVK